MTTRRLESELIEVPQSRLEQLADDRELMRLINASTDLSDEEYESQVHKLGFRVAVWKMRALSFSGDIKGVKALEVYLNRCDQARRSRRAGAKPSTLPSNEFAVGERPNVVGLQEPNTQTDEEPNTSDETE